MGTRPRLDIDLRYGLGCYLTPEIKGTRQIGHEGFLGGMWAKLIIDPARGRGAVWMDNRGEELREQRYEVMAQMFDGLGRIDENDADPRVGAVTARDLPGEYVRAGAPPLTYPPAVGTTSNFVRRKDVRGSPHISAASGGVRRGSALARHRGGRTPVPGESRWARPYSATALCRWCTSTACHMSGVSGGIGCEIAGWTVRGGDV